MASELKLLARSNDTDTFNTPAFTDMINANPVINDRGDVVIKMSGLKNGRYLPGVWASKQGRPGKVIYRAKRERVIPDIRLTQKGLVTFMQYDAGVYDGIYSYNLRNRRLKNHLTALRSKFKSYYYPFVTDDGTLFFRGLDKNGVPGFFRIKKNKTEPLYTIAGKYSYIFFPAYNSKGDYTLKLKLGTPGQYSEQRPDEIHMNGEVLVSDQDGKYSGFSNTLSMSDNNKVCFKAKLTNKNKRAIILYNQGDHRVIAMEGYDGIKVIEPFAPSVNNKGVCVFRALDNNKTRHIYGATRSKVKIIVSPGDLLTTDHGTGRIYLGKEKLAFSGAPSINNRGDVVFVGMLESKNGENSLGHGLIKVNIGTRLR